MEKSANISNLSKALAQFHALVGKISKDSKNPFFKSNYASLPHILPGLKSTEYVYSDLHALLDTNGGSSLSPNIGSDGSNLTITRLFYLQLLS